MDQLQVLANMAEIFSTLTIIGGGVFAAFRLSEFRQRRRYQVAMELCRKFSDADLGRAVNLIRRLPDGISAETPHSMEPEYEESAQIVGVAFETMGLLVYMNLASFQLIQQLTGGLLLTMWRKLSVWFRSTREESGNRRFGEWVQWLAERLEEEERAVVPAYEAYAAWQPKHR